ncbi:STAS domain-containing protein [Catenuloplanes indicus]|uniref:Anti-anti-sigma regulatory factor n=1 Tax=Catenuloplanes indicus TaxID=137267 RepID=A0AAE3W071_9ACTN|nr:STAS domain-containing protein [Catenuloplanes indicus]MDQ0366969.1 anti-anti-sigma regulatory factor [Catenuloplanes indicus]
MTGTRILVHEPARMVAIGEFDRDNRHRIVVAVQHAIADGHPNITIDFAGVTLIDAGTIRALLACRTLALAHGGDLRILRANGVVEFALEVTGATALLG